MAIRADEGTQSSLGIVDAISEGNLYAIDSEGNVRTLKQGDSIYQGEKVSASVDSHATIVLSSGRQLTIPDDLKDQIVTNVIEENLSASLKGHHETNGFVQFAEN
ncbi:MAG: hypothetical protein KDH94_07290, partial [Coxiellaceae bacterium]|nr:hypothetical protein [Coxiellaceae bacterium]